jgi:hypothetical protein
MIDAAANGSLLPVWLCECHPMLEEGGCRSIAILASNVAGQDGGGVYLDGGSPLIIQCGFSGNTAGEDGGAVYCRFSSPQVIACRFGANFAGESGGAVAWCEGHLVNCDLSGNQAKGSHGRGGGLANCSGSVVNCTIVGNRAIGAYGAGGGLADCTADIGTPEKRYCRIFPELS